MRSNDRVSLMCVLIYMNFIYNFYTVSSPYLLVFGDDRVFHYT